VAEHAFANGFLAAAMVASLAGMGWLALSMRAHAVQTFGNGSTHAEQRRLRWLGAIGIVVALALCLQADHASMAVLVWVMSLAGAAFAAAFLLAFRPEWLRLLAPWLTGPAPAAR
jgi:hypothetical protein